MAKLIDFFFVLQNPLNYIIKNNDYFVDNANAFFTFIVYRFQVLKVWNANKCSVNDLWVPEIDPINIPIKRLSDLYI